jgi:AbrB family looped-hinge helix DNA binding protein
VRGIVPGGVRCYLTEVKTTLSSKGQIVIPAELRQMDRLSAGQEFEFERVEHGEYRIKLKKVTSCEGLVEWLLACPHKGYFEPMPSESTDTI